MPNCSFFLFCLKIVSSKFDIYSCICGNNFSIYTLYYIHFILNKQNQTKNIKDRKCEFTEPLLHRKEETNVIF